MLNYSRPGLESTLLRIQQTVEETEFDKRLKIPQSDIFYIFNPSFSRNDSGAHANHVLFKAGAVPK